MKRFVKKMKRFVITIVRVYTKTKIIKVLVALRFEKTKLVKRQNILGSCLCRIIYLLNN